MQSPIPQISHEEAIGLLKILGRSGYALGITEDSLNASINAIDSLKRAVDDKTREVEELKDSGVVGQPPKHPSP